MGKKHRPRPVLYNEPTIPVRSIFRAATKEHIDHVNQGGEVDETTCSLEEWSRQLMIDFQNKLGQEPDLHRVVYAYVDVFVHVYGVAPSTKEIVDVLTATSDHSETGIRGSLSRLVDGGFLTRPVREYYWPADIAFVRERNLPKPKEMLEMGNGSNGRGKEVLDRARQPWYEGSDEEGCALHGRAVV